MKGEERMQQQDEGYEQILTAEPGGVMPNMVYFIAGIICWTALMLAVSAEGYSVLSSTTFPPMAEIQQDREQHFHHVVTLGVLFWGIGLILLYFGHMRFHNQRDKQIEIAYEQQCFTEIMNEISDIISTHKYGSLHNSSVDQGTTEKLSYSEESLPETISQVLAAEEQSSEGLLIMEDFTAAKNRNMILLNINEAIATCLSIVVPEYESVVEIVTDLDADLPPVYATASDMNQIFHNILSNGLQAIHKKYQQQPAWKKGMLLISSRLVGEHIEILFDDDGVGISDDIKDTLFDPLFDGQVKGLAIVHQLVTEKYKGSINVASDKGEGTIFFLLLPAVDRYKKGA